MKVVYDLMPKMTLGEFGDKYGLTLVVKERPPGIIAMSHVGPGRRFYASFSGLEVKDGSILISVSGDGTSPQGAIYDYARKISGERLVVNAMSRDNRMDIEPIHITRGGHG